MMSVNRLPQSDYEIKAAQSDQSRKCGIEPDLRILELVNKVCGYPSLQAASKALNVSQSLLSRKIQRIELQVGLELFERTFRGITPTRYAEMLGVRVERALAFMEIAERNISTLRVSYRKPSQFYKKATRRQLITLLSVYDNNSVSNAARDLCISQPSVTMTLRELEKLIGANLFSRHSKGLLPTEAGEILVKHVKLAMSEIRAAAVDFALIAGGNATHIKIGVLPLAGQILVPKAIASLLRHYPATQVDIIDASYQAQIRGLLFGDIDLSVGGLDFKPPAGITQEKLFDDTLVIVSRQDHPVFKHKRLTLSGLSRFDWVVPRQGTPARTCIERAFERAGVSVGSNAIVTNSGYVRTILLESDRLAVMSRQQIRFEELAGVLAVLPVALNECTIPVGIRRRGDGISTEISKLFSEQLRELSAS